MLSLNAAAAMCRAQLLGDRADTTLGSRVFKRVTTDSRDVQAGDLFVALSGERFDGHDFVPDVLARGAVAALVSRAKPSQLAARPLLLAADTRVALGALATGWRRRFELPVIGVTGSNGKTTVKEMIACILAAAVGEDARLATRGNLNNEVGVPLTVLRLEARHQMAVIELGMNHPGEIAQLAAIAQPTIALVNNAQREHQEFMASVEAVALENGSVFTHLPADGVAVFPAGTQQDGLWRDLAGDRSVVRFGLMDPTADARVDVNVEALGNAAQGGQRLALHGAVQTAPFVLAAFGEHNLLNAAAAAACAHAAGVSNAAIVAGLEQFAPVKGRLQRKRAASGALLIDDTYNANPDSVRAAIDVLAGAVAEHAAAGRAADIVLVLGDMGEVGHQGEQFHAEVGAYAKQRGITRLLALGEATRATVEAFGIGATHHTEVQQIATALAHAGAADVVLVKGSRFMRMERVVAALLGQATP
jgi:UDP-N-acetylmuramoyl-tripeptide--D-alanyl-D-alanine ligase